MLTTKSLQSTDCPMRTLEATHTTFQTQAVQLIPSALDRCLLCLQHHLPLPVKLPHTDKCRLAMGLLFLTCTLAPVLLGDLPVNTPLTRSPQSFPSSLQMRPLETLPGPLCSSVEGGLSWPLSSLGIYQISFSMGLRVGTRLL